MMRVLLLLTVITGISGWNLSLSPTEERLQNRRSGDNFLVVCKVKEYDGAASDVHIEWFKDDKLIPRFGSTMTIERTYSNQLMINRPKISDNGKYTCKAEIQDERQEVSAEISFIDPPKFIDAKPEQHPEEGTTAEIECQVEGTNQLEVFWQFNGVTLDESSQRGYTFSTNKQVLSIPNYTAKRDDGIYNCNAAQYSSFETLTINVTGHARPVITVFDVPAGHRAFEGQTIELKCGAVGKPKPTYKWFFEGEEIQIARTAKHNVDEGLLIIESLNSEDAGKYSCVANNSVGTNEKEFTLEITLKPKIDIKHEHVVKEGDDVEIVCNYDVESGFSAKFISGSSEYAVKSESEEKEVDESVETTTEETEAETEAETETATEAEEESASEESSEVELSTVAHDEQDEEETEMKKWKRFANDVDSGRVSVRSEANKLILTIKNVLLEDAGEYTCSVTNEAGTTNKVSRVGIIHPPILRHYTGSNIRSFEGNTISIYCDVSAVPSPKWKWLKDGEEVEANGASVQIDSQQTSTKLTLQHLEGSENFGKYTCKADNSVGTLERDIEVVRVVKPATPAEMDCKKMIYPNFGKCSFKPYDNEESQPQTIEFLLAKLEEMESDYNWEHAQHISVKFENDTTIPNLAASTQYVVKARAVNEAGKSDYTEEISLETTDPWAPQAPTSLKMECSDYCTLSWDAPNDHGSALEKYRIEVQEMRKEVEKEEKEKNVEVSTLPEVSENSEIKEHQEEDSEEKEKEKEEKTLEYSAEILPTDAPNSSEEHSSSETSSEKNEKNVAFGQPEIFEVSSEEHQLQLTHIRPHSYYKISIAAINSVGQGEPLEIEHQTDESPLKFDTGIDSFYLVIGVAIGVLFVLFLVDLGCFFTNRCGLISCICLNICGKNTGGKQRDVESGRNGPESNRLLDSSGAR